MDARNNKHPKDTVGWNHLETLVDIKNRMAGTDGELKASEATAEAFSAVGARDVELNEFKLQGWERGESDLIVGGRPHECIALPRSPDVTASGELVDLKYGLPEKFDQRDLEGKVVLVRSDVPDGHRYIHRREKYYRSVDAGAAAFVYMNHVKGQLPATGGVHSQSAPIGAIPAVSVSYEVGSRLARTAVGRDTTVSVEAVISTAMSQNVHAVLGPDDGPEVYVTSHVDAHDIGDGAIDNGIGTALLIEIARRLYPRQEELDHRIQFVAYGAEEVGSVGSEHHASTTSLETVRAICNLDLIHDRDLKLCTNGFDELWAPVEAVRHRVDPALRASSEVMTHSDHWRFVKWGVPGYMAMSRSDRTGRGWGHTAADTLDKIDPRNMCEQAVTLTELVVELANDDYVFPHKDPEEMASLLRDRQLAEGLKHIGKWVY